MEIRDIPETRRLEIVEFLRTFQHDSVALAWLITARGRRDSGIAAPAAIQQYQTDPSANYDTFFSHGRNSLSADTQAIANVVINYNPYRDLASFDSNRLSVALRTNSLGESYKGL